MPEIPTTQRAYTLRLRGASADDTCWREALWKTHVAVNRGAKAFGDWLLTLRGGLCHTLADQKMPVGKGKPDREPTAAERCHRRIILALSWLSVESHEREEDAPRRYFVPDSADDKQQTVKALRQILADRGVDESEIEGWLQDCQASLQASVREKAKWVNRSLAFDDASKQVGASLTRDEIWDIFNRFFGSRDAYFGTIVASSSEDDEENSGSKTTDDKAKDLVIKAGGWLSNRFGTQEGSNFEAIAIEYEQFAEWSRSLFESRLASAAEMSVSLLKALKQAEIPSRLAGTPGPSNKVQTTYERLALGLKDGRLPTDIDFAQLAEWSAEQAVEKRQKIGNKGHREWSDALLRDVEAAYGFSYINPDTQTARHREYSVILDHAARRLCQSHSWIKLAEERRRKFNEDARKLDHLKHEHPEVVSWLDDFCETRSMNTGAGDEGYRIRKRAITDWDDVVKKWAKKDCSTSDARIEAAREVQGDPENEKPGDTQLYEALASEESHLIWFINGKPDAQPLKDYVAAKQAEFDKRRFKVPAYRHPDELRHPIFCDFGKSRWDINFAVHRAVAQQESVEATVSRRQLAVEKATNALDKAKTEAKKTASLEKLTDAELKLKESRERRNWLTSTQGLEMTLWDGNTLGTVPLTWKSKRLVADLALRTDSSDSLGDEVSVTRADRFGRAAVDAKADSKISLQGLMKNDEWNGRLQAPRSELDAIADIRDGEKRKKLSLDDRKELVNKMIGRLHWLVSFSAKLQPQGPWYEFTKDLPDGVNFSVKKKRLYYDINKERKARAQLILSRLPGLRLLSVDLGHRYAAACAVWDAVSTETLEKACKAAGIKVPSVNAMYCVVPTDDTKRTVFRRIGTDTLPDGEPHPAPWTRLDRQFLIKLQGEDLQARGANAQERADIERLETELGYKRRRPRRGADWRIDELMSDAVRTVRLALQNHSDYARIARDLASNTKIVPGDRPSPELKGKDLIDHVLAVLVRWHTLATATRWTDIDGFVSRLWRDAGFPSIESLPKIADDLNPKQRKKRRSEIEAALRPVAEGFAKADRTTFAAIWQQQWTINDEAWKPRLKWLGRWIAPRGKKHGKEIRRAGGLSLKRIATFKSLYQVQKAYFTRLRSDGSKVTAKDGFGQRILNAMERMRENRVKQLASRITEAALGIGIEQGRGDHGKQVRRPRERLQGTRFAPCHAVVIENLTHYRPDELQTRRENRQLMTWSAAKVKKYLADHCELYGLHLREVTPAYTSRQDSRTGSPGVRCVDIPVAEFPGKFSRQISAAENDKKSDALSRYLLDLKARYLDENNKPRTEFKNDVLRVPYRGGEVFVSADRNSPIAKGLQADLNAAANIGLKALLDPDWPGTWWYVPSIPQADGTFKPKSESTAGSAALDGKVLVQEQAGTSDGAVKSKTAAKSKDVVNLWHDVSSDAVETGGWKVYSHYKNYTLVRVIGVLRKQFGLGD